MKKVKIICVKGIPMSMTEDAVDRLMANILGPNAKSGGDAAGAAEQNEKKAALQTNVSKMCDKHNNIADQVARVIRLSNDEFDPKKAVTLARTVIKGRMEAIAILGELRNLDKDGSLSDAVTAADMVARQYATMYDDLEDRYAVSFGLDPVGGKKKEEAAATESAPDEPEAEEDPDASEDDLLDAILTARASLSRLLD